MKIHIPKASASNTNYILYIPSFIIGFILLSAFLPYFFTAINHLIYASQNLLKIGLFGYSTIKKYKGLSPKTLKKNLPIYSVLIPLYREEKALASIIHAMKSLDYPKSKLDIKIVLEADDFLTIRELKKYSLPYYFDVIKVPVSLPRTKPKALNYAMDFIKGELVVIYDAEDRPDKDQLLKCANAFKKLPKKVICLQGKLEFYNKEQNLLTRFFNIEYRIWFQRLLPSIDKFDLPLPLGGNSNHFRVKELKEIGMWDPYNVTEDADLGIRLYLEGYRVKMIDSFTFEECPSNIKSWLFQRSRWIKGFIQTFLVFIGQYKLGMKKAKKRSILSIIIFIGLSSYSFMILPFYLFTYHNFLGDFNLYSTLLYMYISAMIVSGRFTIFWPLYFILHVIASYIALYELITNPFKWNKTEHF